MLLSYIRRESLLLALERESTSEKRGCVFVISGAFPRAIALNTGLQFVSQYF